MPEIGPQHPITYRQETAAPLFRWIQAGESCVVVGAASMGKSRFLEFILRPDVRQHYLRQASDTCLLVHVDCNRMAVISQWGLYEMILTALTEAVGQYAATSDLRQAFERKRDKVILRENGLLAQRHVELAMRMVCQEKGLKLCLILDEFDETYRTVPVQMLANLRALRDMNKYRLSYVLLMRDLPKELRSPTDCEGFYELFSRSTLGLGPYGEADTQRIIQQIITRRQVPMGGLGETYSQQITLLSGGHPGLLVALLDALKDAPPIGTTWEEWAKQHPKMIEECRKLWEGLRVEERLALHHFAQGVSAKYEVRDSLCLKGLIRQEHGHESTQRIDFFSPLFQAYASHQAPVADSALRIDVAAGTVWVQGQHCEELTAKEFELLRLLDEHHDEIVELEQITQRLYPGDEGFNISNSSIAALVRRIRKKIEMNPDHPQYLLNIKGRGYRLLRKPEMG